MTYMKKNLHFCNLKKTHYGRTDGRTDQRTDRPTDGPTNGRTDRRTDRPTDRPSYRDARTHLKTRAGQSDRLRDAPRSRLCTSVLRCVVNGGGCIYLQNILSIYPLQFTMSFTKSSNGPTVSGGLDIESVLRGSGSLLS